MIYEGKFIDINNKYIYNVKIGNTGATREIQDNAESFLHPDEIVCFSGNAPVTISYDMSDTFEHVYARNCTINLVSNYDVRKYVVASNYNDIPVEIKMADTEDPNYTETTTNWPVIFSGYVEPMSFNQPFALPWNEFSLECTDKIGILEYIKFHDYMYDYYIDYYTNLYPSYTSAQIEELTEKKINAYDTPREFLNKAINACGISTIQYNIQYDYTETTHINPTIFYGESPDDYMSCVEVIEEIGKIYGVYVFQNSDYARCENLLLMDLSYPYDVQASDVRGSDANISVDEAYKKISCTVDISTIDDNFIDPFNKDNFIPTTKEAERYLSEIMCERDDKNNYDNWGFRGLCENADYVYKPVWGLVEPNWSNIMNIGTVKCKVYDHYAQIVENPLFTFPSPSYLDNAPSGGGGKATTGAKNTLDWLKGNAGKGAFISFGNTGNLLDNKKKEAVQLKDMSNCLIIQVSGHAVEGNATSQAVQNEMNRIQNQIQSNSPILTYTDHNSFNFVPNDASTTNYLVINGNITLNPVQPKTGPTWDNDYNRSRNTIHECRQAWANVNWNSPMSIATSGESRTLRKKTIKISDKDTYYQTCSWDNANRGFEWPYNQTPDTTTKDIFYSSTETGYKKFEYKTSVFHGYDSEGDPVEIDYIAKMSVLACELKIGDKYLCEDYEESKTYNWEIPNKEALLRIYKWKTAEEATALGLPTNFTLGIDPGIGDSILGTKFEIQNNVSIGLKIDAKGSAYPIPYDTNLTGDVTFKILGPVNSVWTEQKTSKHGILWWKHYETESNDKNLLSFTENIVLSDLEFTVVSDNGGSTQANDDNDLVYYSDNNETYKNEEGFECSFCTSLTSQEVAEMGIDYEINNSSILKTDNSRWYGMKSYKDTVYSPSDNNYIKLEEARVSEQYEVWKKPRNVIELTMKAMNVGLCNDSTNFEFDYLPNSVYRITSKDIDLKLGTMNCKMKDYL